jgi:hypothetical protein
MKPSPDAERWVESGPEVIEEHFDDAVLIARIGLAANALSTQLNIIRELQQRPLRERSVDVVHCFAITAALTYQAIQLVRKNMRKLRPFARNAGAEPELLDRMGKLCAGKHEASEILDRIRNQLTFHFHLEDKHDPDATSDDSLSSGWQPGEHHLQRRRN